MKLVILAKAALLLLAVPGLLSAQVQRRSHR